MMERVVLTLTSFRSSLIREVISKVDSSSCLLGIIGNLVSIEVLVISGWLLHSSSLWLFGQSADKTNESGEGMSRKKDEGGAPTL